MADGLFRISDFCKRLRIDLSKTRTVKFAKFHAWLWIYGPSQRKFTDYRSDQENYRICYAWEKTMHLIEFITVWAEGLLTPCLEQISLAFSRRANTNFFRFRSRFCVISAAAIPVVASTRLKKKKKKHKFHLLKKMCTTVNCYDSCLTLLSIAF